MKFMEQLDKNKAQRKISEKDLLKAETLVIPSTNTIITSDVTWEDGVGEIHHGFNMKTNMPENEFKEAMNSSYPGDYILAHYPADGTFVKGHLERLSIEEALALVQDSDYFVVTPDESHHFNYEVTLWRGYGYWLNTPLAFEAKNEEEALVFASLADCAACIIDEEDTAGTKEAEAHPDQWVFLDRSAYGVKNVWLFVDQAIIRKID